MKKEDHPGNAAELRRQAEEIAQGETAQSSEDLEIRSPEATRRMLHELRVHQIELEMQNEELRRAQVELDAVRNRYFDLYDLAPVGYITLSEMGLIVEANLTFANLLGVERSALVNRPLSRFILPEDQDIYYRHRKQLDETDQPQGCELRILRANANPFWARIESSTGQEVDGMPLYRSTISDIADRKQAERHQQLAAEILGILNDAPALNEAINLILTAIKRETGFEAVGIRLRSGEDFPYFAQEGFSNDFLLRENTLVARTGDSGLCRDNNYSLECTCGLVISGQTDPSNPLFTSGGSAWTNNSLTLLDLSPDQDPRLHPRNRCIHEGFLSVALIPIRENQEIIGLLQLNDRRKDCFTSDMIHFFEGLSASIGVAFTRKRAEETLQQSEDKFRLAFQTNPDAISINRLEDGLYVDINQGFTDLTGFTREDVMDKTSQEIKIWHDPADRHRLVKGLRKQVSCEDLEAQFRRKDGSLTTALMSARVFMLWGVPHVLSITRDISERMRAEEAVRESELRFRQMANSIPQLAWIAQRDGYIFWYNQRWYDYTGTTPDQMVGWGWQIVHDPEILVEVLKKWKDSIATGKPFDMVFPLRGADGRFRQFLTRVLPMKDTEGRITQWFGTNTDITERKQMEEELCKARDELESRVQERTAELNMTITRLERVNQELQEFAYVASHDLQEPLRKIQTFSDMAKKSCASLLDKSAQDYLDRVLNSAGRMRQLLNDLLRLSRVDTKIKPFTEIDLERIVREAVHVFEAVVNEKGCQIEIGKMPAVKADESQMLQLFQNLIGNALKFRGGEAPRIQIYGQVDGRRACEIFVKDNGIGFHPRFAELIFKPFERLHGRSQYEGTGMGLSICRKIVERHGGTIRAESEPGKGSTFIIRLPQRQIKGEVL